MGLVLLLILININIKASIKHEITNFTSLLFNSNDDDIDNHKYEHDIENIENCERIGNEVMKAHLERKK